MEEQYEKYVNHLSFKNKLARLVWNIVYHLLFRPFGTKIFRLWRIALLRLFGAKVSWKANVYSTVRIWAPWFLTMDDYACIAARVTLHNVNMVTMGEFSTISEGSFISPGSHDIYSKGHEMFSRPITIGPAAWVAVEAFVGVGVNIGEGAVVGARACVFKDVEPWTVVGGNPAKKISERVIRNS